MPSLYRHHDEPPTGVTRSPQRELTTEWAVLHSLPSTRLAVRRWGRAEERLAPYARPGDVVDAIDAAEPDDKSALLLALLRLFHQGHQLAGRTVLQAMLPRLHRMQWAQGDGSEEAMHQVIAEFWTVAATYPIARRPRKVAANLVMDTINRLGKAARPTDIPMDVTSLQINPHAEHEPDIAQAVIAEQLGETGIFTQDLPEVIAWGLREDVITRDDALLLARVYLTRHGEGIAEAAAELGVSQPAVRKRCSRATHRLVAAVAAQLDASSEAPSQALRTA